MSHETVTLLTCDRCGQEARCSGGNRRPEDWLTANLFQGAAADPLVLDLCPACGDEARAYLQDGVILRVLR